MTEPPVPPGPPGPRDLAETDDRALLAAHVAGDPDAFGVLVARHRDRLWAVALRTTGNREDAADALQDALVAAFRRAEGYRGDAAVTTWLHRVVVNACLDRHRRQAVRRTEALPDTERVTEVPDPGPGTGVLRPRADGDPEAAAERSEQQRAVHAALAVLPLEQRAALVLVDMQGWSVAEAAEVLGVAPGTVKSRCSRGRQRLAELLSSRLLDQDLDRDPDRAPDRAPDRPSDRAPDRAGGPGTGNRDGPARVPTRTDQPAGGGDQR